MNKKSGFTVIEVIVAIIILIGATFLVFNQKNEVETAARDKQRRSDINNIYQNLKEVYYKENGYYPQKINEKNLPGVFPDSFKDPNNIKIDGQSADGKRSDYSYNPKDCNQETGHCKTFELSSRLENEKDYRVSPKNKSNS